MTDRSVAITKNGITKLTAPATPDFTKVKSDKKIEDEEILKILERPLSKSTGSKKNKNNKKKAAKKADSGDKE